MTWRPVRYPVPDQLSETHQADAALAEAVESSGRSRDEVIAGLLRLVTVDEPRPSHPLAGQPRRPASSRAGRVSSHGGLLNTDTDHGAVVLGVAHEAFLSAWPPPAEAIAANVTALRARRVVEQ